MTNDAKPFTLTHGSHPSIDQGSCLLEAAAHIAGEPHSDRPECVCPVIAAFGRAWNDNTPESLLNEIGLDLPALIVNTRGSADLQDRRAIAVADWAVRVILPAWLDLVPSLAAHAADLRELPELLTVEALHARPWAAAQAAAGAAAQAAAYAAWDAAQAAAYAAGAAAGAAAGDAARAAAGAAAQDALAPTVEALQREGAALIRRLAAMNEATS